VLYSRVPPLLYNLQETRVNWSNWNCDFNLLLMDSGGLRLSLIGIIYTGKGRSIDPLGVQQDFNFLLWQASVKNLRVLMSRGLAGRTWGEGAWEFSVYC